MLQRLAALLIATVVLFGVPVFAGEYYYSDEDAYWEYWDSDPPYKVKIPSNASAYVETKWGGRTILEVVLGSGGPKLIVGTLPTADVDQAWSRLSAPWVATADSSRTSTSSQIQTDMGLTAQFRVLTAEFQSGPSAIVRMVAFTKDGKTAYLMFVGNASQYAGTAQQQWLKAVHSFIWR